jgi:transposase
MAFEHDDLGTDFLDRQDRFKTIRRLLKRLENLSYQLPVAARAT